MRTSHFVCCILALLLAGIATGCHKSKEPNCESFASEPPPTYIHLKFVDTQTGANILITNKITTEEVKISIGKTTEQLSSYQWRINNTVSESSPFYGTIQIAVLPLEEPGLHIRKIKVGTLGTATLSYKISKKENTDRTPCSSAYYYVLSDITVNDREFSLMSINNTIHPQFLVVKL